MKAGEPRWRRRPETRRDELLDAATTLLKDRSLGELKVADVARAAGTAKGTFYTYFATKEDLFAALQQRYLDGLVAAMEAAREAAAGDDWYARQETVLAAAIANMYDADDLTEVWERETGPADRPDVFTTGIESVAAGFADEIAAEVKAGRRSCDDPWASALMIVHAIDGAVSHDLSRGGRRPALGPERLTRTVARMLRGLVT